MKKILFLIMLCGCLSSPVLAMDVKPADIICWRSDTLKFAGLNLSVPLLEQIYGEPLLTHAGIVVDKDGRLRTSIQGEGVSESTIEDRKTQFNMGVLLRNSSLTEGQIESVVETAYGLEGAYDWGGYNGQVMDYLYRFPWMPEQRFFTRLFEDDTEYYCSEFTALSFECNAIGVSAREPSLTSPLDLYYYALDEDKGWKVIYTWFEGMEEGTT